MNFFKWLFNLRRAPKKPKLGLALGSGGAKGFAELGALRAFEENGINFDIIAGTSIGSVIGAFYADGYSSTDILELLKGVDFNEITNLFMIKMDMTGMFNVVDRNIGNKNIEDLKKPFCCIATEADTGNEKAFYGGSVAKALCASSSIPPFFKPMIIDGVRYVDGAFSNSVPADRVREMGADYVVSIDLRTAPRPQSFLKKFIPTFESKVDKPWQKGYDFSNVVIHPDLNEYSSVAFKYGLKMYDLGYRATIEVMPKILSDISHLKKR